MGGRVTGHTIRLISFGLILALVAGALLGCSCTVPGESGDDLNTLEKRKPAVTVDGKDATDPTVMEYEADEVVLIWKAGNDGGIEGGGGTPPEVIHDRVYYVTEVTTYHAGWGPDAPPAGTISMKHEDGTVYGPWQAEVVNRAYWTAHPDIEMPAGTYTLIDSDPSTWAQNSASGGTGMGWANGVVPE